MRKKTKMILSTTLCAATLALAGGAIMSANAVTANAETAVPVMTIKAGNLSIEDNVHMKFALSLENVEAENVSLLVWGEAPAEYKYDTKESEVVYDGEKITAAEVEYPVYRYEELALTEMTQVVYVCAYTNVDGVEYYSDPLKYSILEYAYNKLGKTEATPTDDANLVTTINNMLAFGSSVQTYKGINTENLPTDAYTYVRLADATFADGFDYGLFKVGATVDVIGDTTHEMYNSDCFVKTDSGATLTVSDTMITPENYQETITVTRDPNTPDPNETYYLRGDVTDSNGIGATYFASAYESSGLSVTNTAETAFKFEWVENTANEFYLYYLKEAGNKVYIYKGSDSTSLAESVDTIPDTVWTVTTVDGSEQMLITNSGRYLGFAAGYTAVKAYATSGLNTYLPVQFTTDTSVIDYAEEKVEVERAALTVTDTVTGAATLALSAKGKTYQDVSITWTLTENANATLDGNVLTITNPEAETTVTVTATLSCGEYTSGETVSFNITFTPNTGSDLTTVTASKSIADLIVSEGWTNTTTKQEFALDSIVTVKIDGGSNSGKAYDGDHIRIYATDTPAGSLTITLAEGYELVSIKITAQIGTGTCAFLCVDSDTATDICNVTTAVSGSSVVLNSVKNGTEGKQVRITAIEVVYQAA